MGCAVSVRTKPERADASSSYEDSQLNSETSVSRFNGLKMILSTLGSRMAFGQYLCSERAPENLAGAVKTDSKLPIPDFDIEHYAEVIVDACRSELATASNEVSKRSIGAAVLSLDKVKVILVALRVFPYFIISAPYRQWKEYDKLYGDDARRANNNANVAQHVHIDNSSVEARQFDRALATVDLAELDKLLQTGSWLTSLLAAVENLPVCVSLSTADKSRPGFPLIYVNSYFEKVTGYMRSEIIGQNCRFLQGGKSEQDSIERLSYALHNAKPVKVAITNFRKDGMPFKNLLAMKPILDENGRYRYVVGVQFDVTQDEATPSKLKLADEVMRMMPNVILSSDDDDKILAVNGVNKQQAQQEQQPQ